MRDKHPRHPMNRRAKDKEKDGEAQHKIKFIRASELLEEKLEESPEQDSKGSGWLPTPPTNRAYDGSMQLMDALMEEFQGISLDEAFDGETVSNDLGECYKIESVSDQRLRRIDIESFLTGLTSNLRLVCGIGPTYEDELKSTGYRSVEELISHPRWSDRAERFIGLLKDGDVRSLQRWMFRFVPKTHFQIYRSSAFFDKEDFLILDIETMGLFGRVIILLGLAKQCEEGVSVTQYLLKDISNEPCALMEASSKLRDGSALITYNGKAFDVPYLDDRLAFYGLNPLEEKVHFDLLHFSRRLWGDTLPDYSLASMERHLGVERGIDLPSSLVPLFYEQYLETGNPGPLVPIVEHNRQDLLTLVTLFSRIHEEWK